MGPRSRDLLARPDRRRPGRGRLPVRHQPARSTLAGASLRATRMTYVGELGWELMVPVADAVAVYDGAGGRRRGQRRLLRDRVAAAGEGLPRLRPRADARLRTPVEAGLVFATALKGDKDFLGRAALEAHRDRLAEGGPRRRARLVRASRTPSRCSGAASWCSATARRPARSPAPPGARRSGPAVGLATCSAATARSRASTCERGGFEVDVAGERYDAPGLAQGAALRVGRRELRRHGRFLLRGSWASTPSRWPRSSRTSPRSVQDSGPSTSAAVPVP